MAEKHRKRAFLEHLEAYLARRDGVDKALKILRYSSKLWLSSPLISYADPLVVKRVKDFESSVGTSRKAFRLGKFVQDVNALGKIPSYASRDGLLEFIACTGEGIYYFVEQFIWLVVLPIYIQFFANTRKFLMAYHSEIVVFCSFLNSASSEREGIYFKELRTLL